MPQYEMPLGRQQTWQALDEFTQGYWEAAFFTSQETISDLTFADVSKTAYDRAVADCEKFGYWDREQLGPLGFDLSNACERREIDLYVVNDKIHFMY